MRRKLRTLKEYVYYGRSTADCAIVYCSVYADTNNS